MSYILLEPLNAVYALLAAATVYAICSIAFSSRQRLPHPPGPPGLPLLCNWKVPEGPSWKIYRQWGHIYGSDVVRINVLGTNLVVTNTLEASADLLDKRSANYSDRPSYGTTMVTELCGFDWSVALMRYNSFWRDARKAFQHEFDSQAVLRFRPNAVRSSHEFLRNLLLVPTKFYDHIRHITGRELIYSAYGVDVQESDDSIIATAEHGLEASIVAMSPGRFWVDIFPILKYIPAWFPSAGFQRQAKIWCVSVDKMLHVPFNLAKELLLSGQLPDDCAAKNLLVDTVANASNPSYMEDVVRAALGTMYGDIAHVSTEDDVYNGYYIPKGSFIIANTWAILHDPEAYTDPEAFNLDRFLRTNKDGELEIDPNVRDPEVSAFGFGRRICPGRFMGYETLWLAVASVMAAFTISKAKDKDGNEITPDE